VSATPSDRRAFGGGPSGSGDSHPARIDDLVPERLLYQGHKLGQAQQGDGALPSVPNEAAFAARNEVGIAGPQESRRFAARQPAIECDDRDRLEHSRTNEAIRHRIANDLIKRRGIAVEDCGHHAMGGLRDRASQDRIDVIRRAAKKPCERPIGCGFAPLAEQVKDEEQTVLCLLAE
jgi:hypothetical protein